MQTGLIIKETLKPFEHLMLPSIYRRLVRGLPVLAIGLMSDENKPVGALAGFLEGDGFFRLISLYVQEEYRRQGGGILLILSLQDIVERLRIRCIFSYTDGNKGSGDFQAFFSALQIPENDHMVRLFRVPLHSLLQSRHFPRNYKNKHIKRYSDLTEKEIRTIKQQMSRLQIVMKSETTNSRKVDPGLSFVYMEENTLKGFLSAEYVSNQEDPLEPLIIMSDQTDQRVAIGILSSFIDACRNVEGRYAMPENTRLLFPVPDERMDKLFSELEGAENIQHNYVF